MERLKTGHKKLDTETLRAYLASYRDHKDIEARDRIVSHYVDLVRYLAGKFANRGEPVEDLVQVGIIALIRAIDRYDETKGVEFSTYVTPTILGEIKRYFRDKCWALKIPRRLKELNLALGRTIYELTNSLGRPPTIKEIAEEMNATEEEIMEAQELGRNRNIMSFSQEFESDGENGTTRLANYVGSDDSRLECIENNLVLRGAFNVLDRREKIALYFRFYENLSQSRIAEMLGVSQMHVSRVQHKAVEKLRAYLSD